MRGHRRTGPVERRRVTLTPEAAGMVEAWAGEVEALAGVAVVVARAGRSGG